MKLIIFSVLITLFFTKAIGQEDLQGNTRQNISVLFIGNSYTFMHDMPFIFQKMVKEEGIDAYVDTVVQGGKTLQYHSTRKETYEKINSRNWTYIVIQGHSNEFATPKNEIETKSKMYLSRMIDSIRSRNTCTKIILYMTWAYKNGNKNWEPIDSYEKMQNMVKDNYLWMAKDFNTIISPVGYVWQDIYHKKKDLNLYSEDEKHPNLYGSFVAATTFFMTITKLSPIGNALQIDLNPATKKFIEQEVYSVVSEYSKWRNNTQDLKINPGFDVIINNRKVQVLDNSTGAMEVTYKINNQQDFDYLNPEFSLRRKDTELVIRQDVKSVCESVSLTRKILLDF